MPEVRQNGKGGTSTVAGQFEKDTTMRNAEKQNPGPHSARGVNPSSSKTIIGNCKPQVEVTLIHDPASFPTLLDSNVLEATLQAVYILSAARTPIGKFGGSLGSLTAADMGLVAAKAAMVRAGIQPEQVEESIFG